MSSEKNWFENNQTKSVLVYTLLVAATAWGVSRFVLDEKRISLCEAETKSAVTIAETHKAKVSALESDVANLKVQNERYLSWLTTSPKAFPALESRIQQLEKERDEALLRAREAGAQEKPRDEITYSFSKGFSKGESFEDPKTGAVIGISNVESNYKANGVVNLPGRQQIKVDGVGAGESWEFDADGKRYRLKLDSVNWINNSIKASVKEIPK
ncbi:hypothetical protein N5C37_08395 [Pseudomonas mosselii]|uniref:hypothetical protein n=1 Tax=Pseudomonas mosselii TaxID=78327 RepID=UPI00244D5FC4|nr:hypothetical protein [Pseudomonas mosselii]MDH1101128.1 hypothetical protein [Pseudomonas mosselii]